MCVVQNHRPWVGGPGTVLPFAVESFLSWCLAIGCLSVSGYYYVLGTLLMPHLERLTAYFRVKQQFKEDSEHSFPCWLPLTTYTKRELASASNLERCRQLVYLLHHYDNATTSKSQPHSEPCLSDRRLIDLIQTHEILRRLASLAMRPNVQQSNNNNSTSTAVSTTKLGQQLIRIWPQLLQVPKPAKYYPFDVSLIVPCHNEHATDVRRKVQQAWEASVEPHKVQLIVIDAGQCKDLDQLVVMSNSAWGEAIVTQYQGSSGRGSSLNWGASLAKGRVYAFCHSDTRLPVRWDMKLRETFADSAPVVSNSCAFKFSIDISADGLQGGPYPPGIQAIETSANVRCKLWSLPYGDQCLSIPANIFHYIGGFPNQCIMEDYDLVSFLRLRAALVSKFCCAAEQLTILSGDPALCSPRRWQKYGVLYVTHTNSTLVNRYERGIMSAEDIYETYYGVSIAPSPSPWEVEMELILKRFKI